MKTERFETVLHDRLKKCTDTLGVKANEYATEDRLHNFKVAAEFQNCTPITALAGMMAKRTVSVYDLIQRQEQGEAVPAEMWDEKIGDRINYLLLLSALVQEQLDEAESRHASQTEGVDNWLHRPVTETKVREVASDESI